MNADSSPGNSVEKRAIPPGCAALVLKVFRMFWFTAVILLLVVLYGLYAGWSAPRQWSDGFFLAAAAQVMFAGISMLGSSRDPSYAAEVRYVADGNITETHKQLVIDLLRRETFAVRAFAGGVLTILIAWIALRF